MAQQDAEKVHQEPSAGAGESGMLGKRLLLAEVALWGKEKDLNKTSNL